MTINRGGRSARSSAAQSLGANDPRLRRNAQSGATDGDLGDGLDLDTKGRITVAVARSSPFFYNEDGALDFNADDGTEVTPGSRPALRLKAADSSIQVTRDGVRARPTADQVKRANGQSVEAALVAGTTDITALSATVATHTSDIATLTADKAPASDLTTHEALTGAAHGIQARHHCVHLLGRGDAAVTLTNLSAAETLLPVASVTVAVKREDLTGFTQVRLIIQRNSGSVTNGAKIALMYHTALSTTASDYSDIGTSAVEVVIDDLTARPYIVASSWIDLAAGAKADVYITGIGSGGNGALSPTIGYVEAQFR